MAKPEFKKPENVHFKPPETVADWLDEPVAAAPPADDWREFPEQYRSDVHFTAPPFDGMPVLLKAPDPAVDCVGAWKLSRRFEPSQKRFVPCGFWARYRM